MSDSTSKEELLASLPDEILSAETVSQQDLIKFAPVLAQQQMIAYEKKAIDETEFQNNQVKTDKEKGVGGGFSAFIRRNPFAIMGALGAAYCLSKGLAEFGYRGSYKKQHMWMKGRLFSQAFCLISCVGGHQYYIHKHNEKELMKKQAYEMEKEHICRQTGMSPEEFEAMRHNEAQQRQVDNDLMGRRPDGDYFTAEQRKEIELAIKAVRQ